MPKRLGKVFWFAVVFPALFGFDWGTKELARTLPVDSAGRTLSRPIVAAPSNSIPPISTYTAPEIAEGIGAVVLELRTNFPDAKILLLAVFPRSVPGDPIRDKIADVNRIIARLDDQKYVHYLDIGAAFLDDKGYFLPDAFRADNLHPLALGYDIWGNAIKVKLAELLK